MNKTSSLASGGVAVAAIIALKLFAKTAIFASLFGGAAVAKNMYESSVMKVKGEVEEFNKKNPSEPIYMYEDKKELVFNDVINDVSDSDVENANQDALNNVKESMKKDDVDFIEKNKDSASNYFLIKHGWTETHKVKTKNDTLVVSYKIVSTDLE
ncbi:hypothetical protein BG151_001899 [Salmonella enterica subsp. enterica serovar Apapa]|uniref:Uncharacterized protein n=7 Tax=Salmonella enterica TaxID=28901 RepID=A0A702PR21_SALER|nr:hypothetical protein [Salmonella enterica]EAA5432128.1 hypothetical protein [Salmonella enterica subsp. enterica serovar Falkensee]EAB7760753.1 hypothetical protein [Salmonella enterica subsp. enterica serovar Poona]EBG8143002.1 hypothetical protein [Salmonella enterica subsp. enterica serovar Apapa]ECA4069687.1 hypothetical protein [Salmonella enterica subsp. enterica serovar Bredeney]ECA9252158.1 hypothetical protein [Salmonella enterica subsp. enterica serovar Muenster]ECU8051276.1 hypo